MCNNNIFSSPTVVKSVFYFYMHHLVDGKRNCSCHFRPSRSWPDMFGDEFSMHYVTMFSNSSPVRLYRRPERRILHYGADGIGPFRSFATQLKRSKRHDAIMTSSKANTVWQVSESNTLNLRHGGRVRHSVLMQWVSSPNVSVV